MARPMYAELSDKLIGAIADGVYPVGSLLPTELKIAAEQGLSRATVRAALNRLVQLGLVTRQKGVGTRVASATPGSYNASTTSIEELADFGAATDRLLLSLSNEVADEALAARLGCRPGRRWHLARVVRVERESHARPICYTENYIDWDFPTVVSDIGEYRELIATRIASRYGIVIDEVLQVIRPIILAAAAAELLAAVPGEPALQIRRQYRSAGRTIYISVSQHPGDRFEHHSALRRHTPG